MGGHFGEAEAIAIEAPIVTIEVDELLVEVNELVSVELDPRGRLGSRIKNAIESALELIVSKFFEQILPYNEESLNQLVFPDVTKSVCLGEVWHQGIGIARIGI